LPNLRWLTLTVNQIEAVPDDICSLNKLEGLWLAKNRLKKLPERIGDMNLKDLTLYSNEIVRLPDSFFNLDLNKLNLSLNPIKEKYRKRVASVFNGIDFLKI
jgi:Leucine-rich repeat (LRR) protein